MRLCARWEKSDFARLTQNSENICLNEIIRSATVCIHRKTTLDVGGYDETLVNAQDIRLWHKLLAKGDWLHVSKPLLKYRILKGSLSVRFQPEQTEERKTVMGEQKVSMPNHGNRKEANPNQTLAIYHYKLGFAAWVAGERGAMMQHLGSSIRRGTLYGAKAAILLMLGILLPRRWYLTLCGYRGIFA